MMQVGTEKPRFRQDLLAEAIDEQGAKFIDVMDPDSGTVFRFYEVEFSLACAMDGERDVAGIVQWAKDELGVTPSTNEVRTVIATLGELGYLDMAGASKAAAADVPAAPAAAAAAAPAKVAAAPAKVAAAPTPTPTPAVAPTPTAPARTPAAATRTPASAERTPARPTSAAAAAAAAGASDVSLDLSEHLAVGREDVQEAVRQSRVMSAVEAPLEAMEAATPPAPTLKVPERAARPQTPVQPERPAERPASAPQPERPVEAKPPERPVLVPAPQSEMKQPEAPVSVAPEAPVSVPPPERPVEVKQPERPVEVKKPERPVEVKKPAIELPKAPEKQPVPMPEAPRRTSPVLIVLLILVVLGVGAFLVWQFVLNKQSEAANTRSPMSMAPVAPQPPPEPVKLQPEPEPAKIVTSKIEMSSGRPKTILAFFPGTIEWIEDSGKEAKSNDIIMKLVGHKAMEAQVAALAKEVEKLQADMNAAYKARDAVLNDAAAVEKANVKVAAAEKAYNTKADQLVKKTDQLEPYYVRLIVDGSLTILRKAGEKIGENTPIATVVTPPLPSAVFKIPPELKLEVGQTAVLKQGEKLLTCEIGDWEPEKLRVTCQPEAGAVEGAAVSYELP
jgi:hypothetical protein